MGWVEIRHPAKTYDQVAAKRSEDYARAMFARAHGSDTPYDGSMIAVSAQREVLGDMPSESGRARIRANGRPTDEIDDGGQW